MLSKICIRRKGFSHKTHEKPIPVVFITAVRLNQPSTQPPGCATWLNQLAEPVSFKNLKRERAMSRNIGQFKIRLRLRNFKIKICYL